MTIMVGQTTFRHCFQPNCSFRVEPLWNEWRRTFITQLLCLLFFILVRILRYLQYSFTVSAGAAKHPRFIIIALVQLINLNARLESEDRMLMLFIGSFHRVYLLIEVIGDEKWRENTLEMLPHIMSLKSFLKSHWHTQGKLQHDVSSIFPGSGIPDSTQRGEIKFLL